MGRKSTPDFVWCDVCELGTGVVENDVRDEETDTEVPPNWVRIEATRVVHNPKYATQIAARDKFIKDYMAAMMEAQGGNLPEIALTALKRSAEQAAEEITEAPMIVEIAEGFLCHEHAAKLKVMDLEAFVAIDDEEEDDEVVVVEESAA